MQTIELTQATRDFLKLLTPPDCTIVSLRAGPHELEVGYITAGVHEVAKWAEVSVHEIDG